MPVNAPPQINRILLVSISTVLPWPKIPPVLMATLPPSTSLSNSYCTSRPPISLPWVPAFWGSRAAILSISSIYTIPCSVFETSSPASLYNFAIILFTSSPTNPDFVRLLASTMTQGRFKYLEICLIIQVFSYVIVKAFYPLLLIVSYKLSIPF